MGYIAVNEAETLVRLPSLHPCKLGSGIQLGQLVLLPHHSNIDPTFWVKKQKFREPGLRYRARTGCMEV